MFLISFENLVVKNYDLLEHDDKLFLSERPFTPHIVSFVNLNVGKLCSNVTLLTTNRRFKLSESFEMFI